MVASKGNHLYRRSFGWFLFAKVIHFYLRLFYKQIVVEGKEHIPQECPVIFAPNHQNALMDPLVVHFAARMQTVFLARADIFRLPILSSFFRWLKILPVFRIRDGFENLQNNEESFHIAVNVLENKRSVGIFPEATHTNMRKLLPLKKGIPRLAFLAESKNDFHLGVKIVPVGIHYSNYERMGGTVHVMFGKAIDVCEYKEDYMQNQQKAMLLLRDEIAKRLSELVINIDSPIHYYDIYKASELFSIPLVKASGIKRVSPGMKFKSQLAISRLLDQNNIFQTKGEEALLSKVHSFFRRLGRAKIYNLSSGVRARFFETLGRLFWLILFFPFYLYGAINAMPKIYFLRMMLRKFKDRQFHSSLKFVWGIIVSPIFFLAQAGLFYAISGSIEWSFAYLASLPLLVYFSKFYSRTFRSWLPEFKLEYLRIFKSKRYRKLESNFREIALDLSKLQQQVHS